MTYIENVNIEKEILLKLNEYMTGEDNQYPEIADKDGYPLYDKEIKFPDGNRMSIQVIPTENGTAYAQAMLFNPEGEQLGYTVPWFELDGKWNIEYNGNTYITDVITVQQNRENSQASSNATKSNTAPIVRFSQRLEKIIRQYQQEGLHEKDITKAMRSCAKKILIEKRR